MAQGTLWMEPIQRAFGPSGLNVAGAKAYFYLAGSSTPTPVYSDVLLTTQITQPVVADGNGIFVEIFLTPGTAYKVDLQTSAGVSLTGYPADNQLAIPASSSIVAFTGLAGEALTAGQAVYLSDGSGGKNAGQWYKADNANAYSSTTPEVGVVPSSINSGATGTIQVNGQVSGFSALTVGALYYVGTAGAMTATAPTTFKRVVGQADSATTIIVGPVVSTVFRAGAYNSAVQSINSGADTAITFNTEDYDVGALHDNAVNPTRFTIPTGGDGLYLLTASLTYATAAATLTRAYFKKNGTTVLAGGASGLTNGGSSTSVIVSALVQLAATDYVEVLGFQSTGGALNTGDAATRQLQNSMQIAKIG